MLQIPFLSVEGSSLLIIEITEGTFKGLRFLLDTGSSNSVVWAEAVEDYGEDMYVYEEECYGSLSGCDGNSVNTIIVHAKMVLAGEVSDVRLNYVQGSPMYEIMLNAHGFPIAGILGMDVIVARHWIIDIANHCIRCYEKNSNVA